MSLTPTALDRIVVTGIGVVSPLGCDLDSVSQNLTASGPLDHQGIALFDGHIRDFGELPKDTKRVLRKSLKLMNRETQLGVAAAQHAINQSAITESQYDADRVGVCFGAGNVEIRHCDFTAGVEACREALSSFDPKTWGTFGIGHIDPLWILRVLPNMPACHAAIANDLRGPNNTITHARASTNMAIAEARNAILDGDADAMIVGGTGTNLNDSNDDSTTNPAEAAAAFVIERMSAAKSRGATVFGEILATSAATSIATDHRAMPREAAAGAIRIAVDRSQIHSDLITLANADTDFPDADTIGIERLVGDAAAGTSALEIAAMLWLMQEPFSRHSAAISISTMANGLASCVVLAPADPISETKVAA